MRLILEISSLSGIYKHSIITTLDGKSETFLSIWIPLNYNSIESFSTPMAKTGCRYRTAVANY
jgi:hypothetical protein